MTLTWLFGADKRLIAMRECVRPLVIDASIGHSDLVLGMVKSELTIVTGSVRAGVNASARLKWDEWTSNNSLVRNLIEHTSPDNFHDY